VTDEERELCERLGAANRSSVEKYYLPIIRRFVAVWGAQARMDEHLFPTEVKELEAALREAEAAWKDAG
jgi:hypothetical protein